nr:hypothetical protein [Tanacetum cinerariifolium]
MNFFKGMTYSETRPLFEKHYNSNQAFLERVEEQVTIQETKIQKEGNKRQGESIEHEISKKQRMDGEAEELKRHMQIQMLNNVRLEVEKESEMSLELLRLVRRQMNKGIKGLQLITAALHT